MGSKNKLKRFRENETFSNVYQPSREEVVKNEFALKGNWNKEVFKNDHPVILELGCGKGEYSVELARRYPDTNFIGVDIKGSRFWRGAKTAVEENLHNVAFLRTQIELIEHCFGSNEVDEIWITFPDPQPQDSREKKRLTGPKFLERYRIIMKPESKMNLKTDNDGFYAYTLDQIEALNLKKYKETTDLYHSDLVDEVLSIKTYYEKKYLADDKNINYVQWSFEKL